MNLEEFLDALRKTPREWQVYDGGAIRSGSNCPLTAVAGYFSASSYIAAAQVLRISPSLRGKITCAADSRLGSLRARLVEACGLQP